MRTRCYIFLCLVLILSLGGMESCQWGGQVRYLQVPFDRGASLAMTSADAPSPSQALGPMELWFLHDQSTCHLYYYQTGRLIDPSGEVSPGSFAFEPRWNCRLGYASFLFGRHLSSTGQSIRLCNSSFSYLGYQIEKLRNQGGPSIHYDLSLEGPMISSCRAGFRSQ